MYHRCDPDLTARFERAATWLDALYGERVAPLLGAACAPLDSAPPGGVVGLWGKVRCDWRSRSVAIAGFAVRTQRGMRVAGITDLSDDTAAKAGAEAAMMIADSGLNFNLWVKLQTMAEEARRTTDTHPDLVVLPKACFAFDMTRVENAFVPDAPFAPTQAHAPSAELQVFLPRPLSQHQRLAERDTLAECAFIFRHVASSDAGHIQYH